MDAHGDQSVAATGPLFSNVSLTVTATDPDNSSSDLTIYCSFGASGIRFASGSTTTSLSVGTWPTSCYATDPANNQSNTISFNIVVQPFVDTTPPVIQAFDVNAPASSRAGTTVYENVLATDPDNDQQQLTVTCVPSLLGGLFPIGVTRVTCNAHDPAGNQAVPVIVTVTITDGTTTGSTNTVTTTTTVTTTIARTTTPVTATVTSPAPPGSTSTTTTAAGTTTTRPTTAPTIRQLSNIVVDATSPIGAVVHFSPTVNDPGGHATTDCKPASGSLIGLRAKAATNTVTVICNASDGGGLLAKPMAFTITVLGARDQLHALREAVLRAQTRSLAAQLARADAAIADGRTTAAQADLASFIKAARSRRPAWIKAAARIIALLG
ncbi:MAG: HYR domain-containing protein [Actinomycetota bacterium]